MVKNLPQDEFAEKTILGICLMDARQATDVLSSLDEEDFYVENMKNRIIFRAMRTLYDHGIGIDIATVANQLTNTKDIDKIGGIDYLMDLTKCVTNFANTEFYVKGLKEKTLLRNFLVELGKIEREYETKEIKDINSFVADCEGRINLITQNRKVGDFISMKEAARQVGEKIRNSHNVQDTITGISTGFEKLDQVLNGFSENELIILAARPAVGKSALALNMALHAATQKRGPVALFSLEMANDMIVKRLFASRTSVPFDRIQKGVLSKEERLKLRETENDFAEIPLYIDDHSGNSIDDICLKARKLKDSQGALALIVIDYIGLINDTKNVFKDNEQGKIAFFSRRLKVLAGELHCPVLCLAQLNRKTEERDNKRPQLSDLRSSGAIEADADKVMFIYRPGYYESQGINLSKKNAKYVKDELGKKEIPEEPQDTQESGDKKTDLVEIIVAKNRNGSTTNVELFFMKQFGKFFSPSQQDQQIISKYQSNNVSYEDIVGDDEWWNL